MSFRSGELSSMNPARTVRSPDSMIGGMADEAKDLQGSLDQVRRHVLGIVDGLSEEQCRRPVLPSGWSCLGLVNHLAIDVERFWFRAVMSADQAAWDSFDDGPSAWQVAPGVGYPHVAALYRDEISASDQVIAALPIDAPPAAWPEGMFGSFRLYTLREVMLHTLTETAVHAGHLDAARELIDGRQWMVL